MPVIGVTAAAALVLGIIFLAPVNDGGSLAQNVGIGQNSHGGGHDGNEAAWGGDGGQGGEDGQGGDQGGDQGGEDGGIGGGGNGPVAEDFVDIAQVPAVAPPPEAQEGGSTGTFVTECGVNANGLFNSENVIVAPGVEHGAQHTHDYVGNQNVNQFTEDIDANNQLLLQGESSCDNGDKSMHYWPVLRDTTQEGADADVSGGGLDGNIGRIITPSQATLEFRGNTVSDVTEMPEFLQIITGNARAFTTNGANANAQWTCTGFEDQISGDKYPLCPEGSDVVRIMDFPSCWDGQNITSEDKRSHIVFPDGAGACPGGTQAVPQLRQTLVYEVPEGANFAVDGFPEEQHKPITDHSDFINVMPQELMATAVECINSGRDC
ncbi:DUF1996 domain-containing protein [Nocardiopsis mangrovi]|uniref:DUF1996 domain-containing protein n=1 Tax=Nocardiopsis mangrovi TaxID=1179818 RepID=A0ABV9DZ47_9ACTN